MADNFGGQNNSSIGVPTNNTNAPEAGDGLKQNDLNISAASPTSLNDDQKPVLNQPPAPSSNGSSFLSASSQKSPLEESAGDQASVVDTAQIDAVNDVNQNQTPINKPITALAPEEEGEKMSSTGGVTPPPQEPTPAPNTDEFLKSILSDPNTSPAADSQGESAPSPLPATPGDSQPVPASIPSASEPTTSNTGLPESPASEPPSPEPLSPSAPTPTENKVFDSTNSLDSIVGQNNALKPEEIGQPVAPNVVSAMQNKQNPPRLGKIILLFVLAVIIVVAGYMGFLALFGKKNSTATTTTSVQTTSTVVTLTNDELRKQDLKSIQNALINYKAGSGRFPIATTLTYLNSSDNILAKELVPMYLDKLPVDPNPTKNYAYKSDGLTFSLTASLDDLTDPQAVNTGGVYIYELTEIPASTQASTTTTSSSATAIASATATASVTTTTVSGSLF